MTVQPLLVKESRQHAQLQMDLSLRAHEVIRNLGKDMSWFQFAKKTKLGYRFLTNRERQWLLLEQVAQEVAQDYPSYRLGQVVDILADLVNHRLIDYMARKGVEPHPNLTPKEFIHTQEWLITLVQHDTYIPRSPWFLPLKDPFQNRWVAKDLVDNETVTITRREETDYFYFSVIR